MRISKIFLLLAFGLTQLLGGFTARAEDQRSGMAYVRNGDETLTGYFYKPAGKGPFPAVLLVRAASRPFKLDQPPYADVVSSLTSRGYVVVIPAWHLPADIVAENAKNPAKNRRMTLPDYQGMTRDIAAAVTWAKSQSFVDEERVSVMGHATGAILSLLLAEQGVGIRACVVFSPGAAMWKDREDIQQSLSNSVREAKAPIFLIQAQNDLCLGPSELLGNELSRRGDASLCKVFPPFGSTREQGNTFAVTGSKVWGDDVFKFLQRAMN